MNDADLPKQGAVATSSAWITGPMRQRRCTGPRRDPGSIRH
jgi:hypothetical protein